WQTGERIGQNVYPFAQNAGPVWLVALNSSVPHLLPWDARGAIDDEQWACVSELVKQLSPGRRIFVSHYPILKVGGQSERFWHGMPDWRRVQERAAAAGCVLWLHGHQHRAYNVPVSSDLKFPTIGAGSATQVGTWGYNEYVIVGPRFKCTRRAFEPEAGKLF